MAHVALYRQQQDTVWWNLKGYLDFASVLNAGQGANERHKDANLDLRSCIAPMAKLEATEIVGVRLLRQTMTMHAGDGSHWRAIQRLHDAVVSSRDGMAFDKHEGEKQMSVLPRMVAVAGRLDL